MKPLSAETDGRQKVLPVSAGEGKVPIAGKPADNGMPRSFKTVEAAKTPRSAAKPSESNAAFSGKTKEEIIMKNTTKNCGRGCGTRSAKNRATKNQTKNSKNSD